MKNILIIVLTLLASIITLAGCGLREEIYATTYSRSNYFKMESDDVTSGYNRDFNSRHQLADNGSDGAKDESVDNTADDKTSQGLPKLANVE